MNQSHHHFLSLNELQKINEAKSSNVKNINISLDLGVSINKIFLKNDSNILIKDDLIPLPDISILKNDQRTILKNSNGAWYKWQLYDEKTNKFYKMIYNNMHFLNKNGLYYRYYLILFYLKPKLSIYR